MNRVLLGIVAFLVAAGVASAATYTASVSGSWSDPATWGGSGAPGDGDTVTIGSGKVVTFDTNANAYATGNTITINSGGVLQASTNAGTYVLKLYAGGVTVNAGGAFLVGSADAPYPTNCDFGVSVNGAGNLTGAGYFRWFGTPATNLVCTLASAASAGATNLVVSTNLTGDIYWNDGNTLVDISNINQGQQSERRTASRFAVVNGTNLLTITSGLTSSKLLGSVVTLVKRNVSIYGTTYGGTSSQYGLSGTTGTSNQFSAVAFFNLSRCFNYSYGNTLTSCTLSGNNSGLIYSYGNTLTSCTLSGNSYGLNYSYGNTLTSCTLSGNNSGLSSSYGNTLTSCTLSGTECVNYLGVLLRNHSSPSYNHQGVAGAFRAWTGGGIIDSSTTVTNVQVRSYKHNLTSTTYPTYMDRAFTLDPNETLRCRSYIMIDAIMAYAPRILLLQQGYDPLQTTDASVVPLAEAAFVGSTTNAWQASEVQWTNTNATPLTVLFRTLGKAESGNAYFESSVIRMTESWGQ